MCVTNYAPHCRVVYCPGILLWRSLPPTTTTEKHLYLSKPALLLDAIFSSEKCWTGIGCTHMRVIPDSSLVHEKVSNENYPTHGDEDMNHSMTLRKTCSFFRMNLHKWQTLWCVFLKCSIECKQISSSCSALFHAKNCSLRCQTVLQVLEQSSVSVQES